MLGFADNLDVRTFIIEYLPKSTIRRELSRRYIEAELSMKMGEIDWDLPENLSNLLSSRSEFRISHETNYKSLRRLVTYLWHSVNMPVDKSASIIKVILSTKFAITFRYLILYNVEVEFPWSSCERDGEQDKGSQSSSS